MQNGKRDRNKPQCLLAALFYFLFSMLHFSLRSALHRAEEDVFQGAAARRDAVDRDASARDGIDERWDIVEAVHADAHLIVRTVLAGLDDAEFLDSSQERFVV